jgi:4,5-DOPA dioxygenase extradiol
MSPRMPVLFVGHGSPVYAIEDNHWSRGFRALPSLIRKPSAILTISAHWFTDGTLITGNEKPITIHDFFGFPRELNEVQYSAPGNLDLGLRIKGLIGEDVAEITEEWGLDHGTWSVLRWMYPKADVPVVQLSINRNLSMLQHFELAKSLAPLRDEDVLIIGSGNITHNLRDIMVRMQTGDLSIPNWAAKFDRKLKDILEARDTQALLELWPNSDDARRAHPTPDHFLPIIYTYATTDSRDVVRFPIEGFDRSSSMRAIMYDHKTE